MASVNPKLKAVVIASNTIPGEFSMRAIKGSKQVPVQLALKDAGFIPGDLIQIMILEEYKDLVDKIDLLQQTIETLERKLEDKINERV